MIVKTLWHFAESVCLCYADDSTLIAACKKFNSFKRVCDRTVLSIQVSTAVSGRQ